jgi:hypothetical protein
MLAGVGIIGWGGLVKRLTGLGKAAKQQMRKAANTDGRSEVFSDLAALLLCCFVDLLIC